MRECARREHLLRGVPSSAPRSGHVLGGTLVARARAPPGGFLDISTSGRVPGSGVLSGWDCIRLKRDRGCRRRPVQRPPCPRSRQVCGPSCTEEDDGSNGSGHERCKGWAPGLSTSVSSGTPGENEGSQAVPSETLTALGRQGPRYVTACRGPFYGLPPPVCLPL
jgi:hypothetical protein